MICALMSPYAEARQKARDLIGAEQFVLVYVATPLHVCESRDVKGLYARARRGEIQHVIGIDEAYEEPEDADLRLDTRHKHGAGRNSGHSGSAGQSYRSEAFSLHGK